MLFPIRKYWSTSLRPFFMPVEVLSTGIQVPRKRIFQKSTLKNTEKTIQAKINPREPWSGIIALFSFFLLTANRFLILSSFRLDGLIDWKSDGSYYAALKASLPRPRRLLPFETLHFSVHQLSSDFHNLYNRISAITLLSLRKNSLYKELPSLLLTVIPFIK